MNALVRLGLLGLSLVMLAGCPATQPTPKTLPEDRDVATDGTVPVVSLMLDAELTDTAGLQRLTDFMLAHQLPTTVYVTAEYANAHATLVQELATAGFEIALHGYSTGEQLATMTYAEQKDLISRALTAVTGCVACGESRQVLGFRPQYFSQNEDTYRILDELGLTYDSGFKASELPVAGIESARIPTLIPGHNVVAVPVTTVTYNGKLLYLCDISLAQSEKLSADQFGEVLALGYQQAKDRGEPLVANFHGWYTGDADTYDYWPVFREFVTGLITDGAAFVRSGNLVRLYNAATPAP